MPEKEIRRKLIVRRLGRVPFQEALAIQEEMVVQRREERIPDHLLLLEHPHVITMGTSSRPEHVLLPLSEMEEQGISLFQVGRGGDVTYHGPGQLVGYPILSLSPDRKDLHRYLRDLEEVLLRALGLFGISAHREPGLTGIWVRDEKVAAIGVRVSSGWITSHGFALNVDPMLSYFETIVPCGIRGRSVTSMRRILGRSVSLDEVVEPLVDGFSTVFATDAIVV
jgi:lipoyl(octanoyl) transferase